SVPRSARDVEVAQSQRPLPIDLAQPRQVQEWFEHPEPDLLPDARSLRVHRLLVNANAVVGEGEVRDLGGRGGHVTDDAVVARAFPAEPGLAHGAALWLVTVQADRPVVALAFLWRRLVVGVV